MAAISYKAMMGSKKLNSFFSAEQEVLVENKNEKIDNP